MSGFNVFPKEIDEVMMSHPDVIDSCSVGVPDEHSGERPKSFVVLREGAKVTEQELIDYCHERLTAYKAPRYVEFLDAIPQTKAHKQDKNLLKRMERERYEASKRAGE